MDEQKKSFDEVTEEYDRLHNIPIDITDSITHPAFVAGVQNHTVGIKVIRGEPCTLVTGFRKAIFNFFVMLYLAGPALIIPFWAYHEGNWWFLFGIPVASIVTPLLAQRKGNGIGGLSLLACIVFWFAAGIHNYFTFFSLCILWGYMFFQIAESTQNDYALQLLMEKPELFARAIAEKRIIVIKKRT